MCGVFCGVFSGVPFFKVLVTEYIVHRSSTVKSKFCSVCVYITKYMKINVRCLLERDT